MLAGLISYWWNSSFVVQVISLIPFLVFLAWFMIKWFDGRLNPDFPKRNIFTSLMLGFVIFGVMWDLYFRHIKEEKDWPWPFIGTTIIAPLVLLIWYWRHIHKCKEIEQKDVHRAFVFE